ncbi:vegetative cell wall protein gp1-like [Actinidia eriantha]|uniref:vegetative cell wall protein gp1-like n=1 Tax=Actinidia eriantha TaxID=165200 RepID=UPI002589AABC|nr:vegetative cell wall protein gp1-like [Actinidia eriantha]XP_057461420.1 vegetative cell wall protein gp1-like [Actinidia eriantha]XP_057461422.1 vegetative cell wall protein gp1-like [Actinidia eriantha]
MASSRANKYASLNFNDVYEKKTTNLTTNKHHQPSSSSLSNPNKTILSNSRIHGNMLVLTRPSPKPLSQPPPPPPQPPQAPIPDPTRSDPDPDPISLRPLGRTGSGPSLVPSPLTLPKSDKEFLPPPSPKTNRFVPPHLRPGFAGREEKPETVQGVRSRNFGSYGEDGRPKSGGGYERMRIVGDSDLVEVTRRG